MPSKPLKLVVLGGTQFTAALLADLASHQDQFDVRLVVGIAKKFHISYSRNPVRNVNYSNLGVVCRALKAKYREIGKSKKDKLSQYSAEIEKIKPDVILVLGWYYTVSKKICALAKHGAWGIHASLLPNYAGGAPLVWAMIEGQKYSGVTLFRMSDTTDGGDIIAQKKFTIAQNDTIKEVYAKAMAASKIVLLKALGNINRIKYKAQNASQLKIYPQRSPKDGEIDLKKSAQQIYDFIRAQSSPYPGAFLCAGDGQTVIIEKARLGPRRRQL